MRIPVPRIVLVITAIFATVIPTIVGLLAWISPDNAPLFVEGAHDLARQCGCPAIALGGMNQARFDTLNKDLFVGWAGIDAFIRG